ncbi:hypothetical protein HMPREF2863_05775 [Micrococcus sp. HMSC067E09]|uniref:VanZ family protein n=1 Tax=Micrococcus sp. HMSC067E09 TaxID=1739367 RepID=UPI0008A5C070|nr:VanZ family protein [Micrococcus sp. HMSC067E09]OFR90745.1 hypothetical protein HMPREF2863_05775 [Micrococcus sp. HMSC067E09]
MSSWISTYAGFLPLLVGLGVAVAVVLAVLRWRGLPRGWSLDRVTALWLFVMWLMGVAVVTLVGTVGMGGGYDRPLSDRVDLVPLRSVFTAADGVAATSYLEPLFNIAMFAVGGLVAAWAFRWSVARTAVVFLALGVGIELLQTVVPGDRSITVDDVLWAVLGGALGALVATALRGRSRPASGAARPAARPAAR